MDYEKNMEDSMRMFMDHYVFKNGDLAISDTFKKVFFVNERESIRNDAKEALRAISVNLNDKMDEYLYKELDMKTPEIDRREIINRITFYTDLSKTIQPLMYYDALVTEVINSNSYDWKLTILDGIPYLNTYGRNMELLYPNKKKGLVGERHLFKDFIVYSKKCKTPEEKATCSVILEFIYWIRKLCAISHERYSSILNFTDLLAREFILSMYGNDMLTKFKNEYYIC